MPQHSSMTPPLSYLVFYLCLLLTLNYQQRYSMDFLFLIWYSPYLFIFITFVSIFQHNTPLLIAQPTFHTLGSTFTIAVLTWLNQFILFYFLIITSFGTIQMQLVPLHNFSTLKYSIPVLSVLWIMKSKTTNHIDINNTKDNNNSHQNKHNKHQILS